MVSFYGAETTSGAVLLGAYSFELVAVSYIVAATAGFTGFRLARYGARSEGRRWLWPAVGGVVMGTGVWAMHFLGMMAFKLPIPVDYDVLLTFVSALPAVMGCVVALTLIASAASGFGHSRRLLAGCIIGLSVGVMHYSGMAAMRMEAFLLYDPSWFVLSIGIAVVLGICAVYADAPWSGSREGWIARPVQFLSAAVMGLAVSGMHYVAMEATICIASGSYGPEGGGLSESYWLAAVVSIVSLAIAGTAILAARIDSYVKATRELIRVNRRHMIDAIESISDGFVLFDGDGQLVVSNSVFLGMYPGLKPQLVPGTSYEALLRAWTAQRQHFPEDQDKESYISTCLASFHARTPAAGDEDKLSDGRWAIVRLRPVEAGGLVGVWSDVTAIKEREHLFETMALTDPLTLLPNRTLFRQRLANAVKRASRTNRRVVVMFVDLNKFKQVNDTYGHDAGDCVLQAVGSRLRAAVRETDTVARLGGDEFALVLEHVATQEESERLAQKILDELALPIPFQSEGCRIGASIGISAYPDHGVHLDDLLRHADGAMYQTKRLGLNGYKVADPVT